MKLEKFKQRNPKKIGIAVFTIACVLLIAFVFIYSSFASFETNETRTFINGNVVDPGDLYFAFYVDGVISSTVPAKGEGYTLDKEKTTCTNGATVEWLDDEWAPKINNLNATRTKCKLYFRRQTAAEEILAMGETAELSFDETPDNNLRYQGNNPQNYITMGETYENNLYTDKSGYYIYDSLDACQSAHYGEECILIHQKGDLILWRIIGVFNNIDNGTDTKEARLKIIFSDQYFKGDYHETVFYWTNQTGSEATSDWLSSVIAKELEQFAQNFEMIGNSDWPLGGITTEMKDPHAIYTAERSQNVYPGSQTHWLGKLALPYASDVLLINNDAGNWLLECFAQTSYGAFILTPLSTTNQATGYSTGYGTVGYSTGGDWYYSLKSILPVGYILADTYITGGSGSKEDPYRLSLLK